MEIVEGGVFLRKTPLGIQASARTRIENAASAHSAEISTNRPDEFNWPVNSQGMNDDKTSFQKKGELPRRRLQAR